MCQGQPTGVQHQSSGAVGLMAVKRIAHDGVTDGLQMHSNLVRAAGHGLERKPRGFWAARKRAPAGLAGLAMLDVDLLQRAPGPIDPQRQIDRLPRIAGRAGRLAMHHGDISLFNGASFKSGTEQALAHRVAGHDHQSGGGHVQAVNDERTAHLSLHARAHAVVLVGPASWHAQQAGWLFNHQQIFVHVEQAWLRHVAALSSALIAGERCYSCPLMSSHTGLRELFALRDYMRMWAARLSSTAAQQMLMVAVGWQMYELTNSAWDLGLVGLYQFAPALLFTLVAGHAADRWHRGLIVALCLLAQAVAALVLVAATAGWGQASAWLSRELLLGVSVLLGLARAFQMPAQQALAPLLVPASLLPRATAFNSAGTEVAVIGGPALGGLVFVAGASAVYGLCLALLLLASAMALRLQYRHTPPAHEPVTLASVFAGLTFVWRSKLLLGAVSLDLFAVLLGGATALLPIFAKDILQVGPWGLGLLRAAPAVGALIMSLVLTRWSIERRVGHKLLAAVAVYGLCMLVFGVSTSFLLSLFVLAVSGAADMVSVVIRMTLVQLETPDDMRGRVSAVNSIFIGASNQLGEFESGATAAWLGPVGSVVLGGVGTLLVAAAWLRLFPSLAQRDRMER